MAIGLENVVVAETELSSIDGQHGSLVIRGHRIGGLVGNVDFEGVVHLLEAGELPVEAERVGMSRRLGKGREQAWVHVLAGLPLPCSDPMDALRSSLAVLESTEDPAAVLIGAAAVFVAAWDRKRRGLDPVAPDPTLGHAADLLRMLDAQAPTDPRSQALDAYLVTVVDHGLNASTFAARVVASTWSDPVSAVVAAVGALKGPLHGGAPGPVLDMLDRVGTPSEADAWGAAELTAGRRIMGMGHRVYRVRDPRAAVLETALRRLDQNEPDPGRAARLELARAVEAAAETALSSRHADRPIRANVEFYTALLLEALGLDRALFPAIFACSRVAGWVAHAQEQRRTGRLMRPRARYVGPPVSSAG